jgi:hypothetical protein
VPPEERVLVPPDERVLVQFELRCRPLDVVACRVDVRFVRVVLFGVTEELPVVRRLFDRTPEEFLDVDVVPDALVETRAPVGKFIFVFTVGNDVPLELSRTPILSLPPNNTEPSVRRWPPYP